MKPPGVLNYQSATKPPASPRRRAVFFPFHWISLTLGSISVLGFLAVAAWPATWSAGISIVSLLLAIFARTGISGDRSIRSCSIWLAGGGSLIFGVIGLIEMLLLKC